MDLMHFAQPAEMYQRYFVPGMFIPSAALLLDHAALRPGERVLDVGCGTGIVSRMAAPIVGKSGHITGLDIGAHMLAVARSLTPPEGAAIEWLEGDATNMPLPSATFDAVVSQHALPFMHDRAAAVREMRRVLKPGGRAIVVVWRALDLHPVFDVLCRSVAHHLGVPLSETDIAFALPDAEKFGDLFRAARFSKVDVLTDTVTARFPDAENYVPLTVATAPAATPAFKALREESRAAVLEAVRADVEPVARQYRDGNSVKFPMFANIAVAIA